MKKEEIEQLKKQLNDISDKIKQLEKPHKSCSIYEKKMTPATDKEVAEALKALSIKKGYKEGVKVKCLFDKIERTLDKYDLNHPSINEDCDNSFNLGPNTIMRDGKWAEIVKEEKIMIGGKEVVFEYGQVFVDGLAYSKKDILNIKAVLDINKIQSLNVGRNGQYKVDLPLINKILDKLK